MTMQPVNTFVKRLAKIGIQVELFSNVPWIYLDTVNGQRVKEKFMAEHGFTIAFVPLKGQQMEFTDITKIFQVIRSYRQSINIE